MALGAAGRWLRAWTRVRAWLRCRPLRPLSRRIVRAGPPAANAVFALIGDGLLTPRRTVLLRRQMPVAPSARARGVACVPGRPLYPGDDGAAQIRLAYSRVGDEWHLLPLLTRWFLSLLRPGGQAASISGPI